MHVITVRNVHDALPIGLGYLNAAGQPYPSRAGDVLVAPGPVTTVYTHPCERVLFHPERDANPFFHFFEALWMLAGRRDVAFLQRFLKEFDKFSDDGINLHGAYGRRWRRHWHIGTAADPVNRPDPIDQLERIVALLSGNPFSRRAVLTMWDPVEDLRTDESGRDLPCNLIIHFQASYGKRDEPNRLNMTVFCRSNDLIFGLAGANAVHFSFLQEYMATRLGLVVGTYYQVSDNYHAYLPVFKKVYRGGLSAFEEPLSPYEAGEVAALPIMEHPATWDRDLTLFLEDPSSNGFDNSWFARVVKPLWWAHAAFKSRDIGAALEIIEQCQATDWRRAAREWLERRKK